MATNRFGLDCGYIGKNLQVLVRDIQNYTPAEMRRSLVRLSDTCTGFAKCKNCGGYETVSMQHDASRWFCNDCNKPYKLADV